MLDKMTREELEALLREAADVLMDGIGIISNAKEHTTDDPEVWQMVSKRYFDSASAIFSRLRTPAPDELTAENDGQ